MLDIRSIFMGNYYEGKALSSIFAPNFFNPNGLINVHRHSH